MTRRPRGSVLELVTQLASRPDGVSTTDLVDRLGVSGNSSILTDAERKGYVFGWKHRGHKKRYFLTREARDAYQAQDPAKKPRKPPATPKPHQSITIGQRDRQALVHGKPVMVDGVALQHVDCHALDARWQAVQLEPDPRFPSFASVPLGVNPDTGRAWEAA